MRSLLNKTAALTLLLGAGGLQAFAQTQLYPGIVKAEVYNGIGGTDVASLTNNAKFPNSPDVVAYPKFLEYPAGPDDGTAPAANVGGNYGMRISGVIIPKETADYVFYVASDDNSSFFLSTDANPANKKLIAWEPTWNPVRDFSATTRRPGCDTGNCENVSDPIHLVANQQYYFEGLQKEGGGGDNFAVAWAKSGDPAPDTTSLPIGKDVLGLIAPVNVAITAQPRNTAAFSGTTANFSVGINGVPGVTYQWKKNGTDIANATNATFTTAQLADANSTDKYSVVVKGPNNTVTSSEATVSVVPVKDRPGVVRVDVYNDITGTAVGDLTNNPAFPSLPTTTTYAKFLEYPAGADDGSKPAGNVQNNYGERLTGFIVPKTTGDYTFYLASDDNSSFFLSTDSNPANKKLIAWEPQWNPVREFSSTSRRPGCDSGDCENVSDPIHLVANQRYYFEGLMKEGGGGDNFAVAWSNDGSVPDNTSLPIDSQFLVAVEPTGSGIADQPQNVSAEDFRNATFSVGVIGTGGYTYQWQTAPAGSSTFTDIAGATSRTLTTQALKANDQAQYRVVVKAGTQTLTSSAATLTVTPDVTAPTISTVGNTPGGVLVYFSEGMGAGATTAGNYTLTGGATVSAATQVGPGTIFLQTAAPLTAGTSYTLTVNGVKDVAGNTLTANTATLKGSAALPANLTQGLIPYERWEGLSPSDIPTLITEITNRPPDVTEIRTVFDRPDTGVDNHGDRLSGWFIPPSDGTYVFAACSDDNGRLFLSTDSDPANKKLIALQPSWDNYRTWTSGYTEKHSDTYGGNEWPGKRISLKAGQPYYIEYIWQDGGGGDDGGATFWKEGEAVPANGTPSAIQGALIKGAVTVGSDSPPIVTTPLTITNKVFNKGDNITLGGVTVTGPGPFTYQWYRNKMPIAGATSATLTINNADHRAIGDYSLKISNANGSVQSNPRATDDTARLIMAGAYNIEAEDFNYEGGKSKPEASTMPYLGNAYNGLKFTQDIDVNNGGDESGGAAFAYSRDLAADASVVEMKGPSDPPDYLRGSFSVTNNYAIGWGSDGDWQNYTRTVPKGKYVIFAGTAQDGEPDETTPAMKSTLSKVTGATTANQTVTDLGTFQSPNSGAWSSNDIYPLTDASGNIVQVDLDGQVTLRWTNNSGEDQDYLLLYCLDCATTPPPGAKVSIAINGTNVTISSDSGGTVEATDALGATSNWTAVGPAPQTVSTNGKKAQFFRVRK